MSPDALESLLKRDRLIVAAGLLGIVLLAWIYTLAGVGMGMNAWEMTAMTPLPGQQSSMMMQSAVWSFGYAALMVAMWWVMMVAMMLPSAAPMILLFAHVHRQKPDQTSPAVPVGIFVLGYLVVWALFSVLATGLQWLLQQSELISPMLNSTSQLLGGGLLIAAGLYQLTPLKQACLKHCRTPFSFVMQHWRQGNAGAFVMGLEHGAFCLGCCWILMALLFVGGVMNLYWIAGLALFVLLEKTIPRGHRVGMATGILLVIWGVVLIRM